MAELGDLRHDIDAGYCPIEEFREGAPLRVRNEQLNTGLYTAMFRLKKGLWRRHEAATYPARVTSVKHLPLDPDFSQIGLELLDSQLRPQWEEPVTAILREGFWERAASHAITIAKQRVVEGYLLDDYSEELDDELEHLTDSRLPIPAYNEVGRAPSVVLHY